MIAASTRNAALALTVLTTLTIDAPLAAQTPSELELKPDTGPVEVLVIDRAERPSPN